MVLESNRDLVLRRLTEALGRDRTRHQVSEVTSLGLVQMTRKRLGTGLLEAFSTTCTCCNGRGIVVHANPVEISSGDDQPSSRGDNSKRTRRNRRGGKPDQPAAAESKPAAHSPAEHPMFRAMASHTPDSETPEEESDFEVTETGSTEPEPAESVTAHAATTESAAVTTEAVVVASAPTDTGAAATAETGRATDTENVPVAPVDSIAPVDSVDSVAPVDSDVSAKVHGDPAPEMSSPPASGNGGSALPVKRRRAVRRKPAAPTTATDPAVIAEVIASPVTTSGPVGTATSAEPAVAVRRTPRRRAAGRPAGPPVEE
jgi:ribonuclease E